MKYLSHSQVLDLLATTRIRSERDFCMILLAYRHGMRASEVVSLRTEDFEDGFVTIRRLKGSNATVQPLFSDPNPLLDEKAAITTWLKTVPAGGRLFPITRQHFYAVFSSHVLAAALPAHLRNPHTMKHSAAMTLVKKVSLPGLQEFLGHRSLQSTAQYLKVSQQSACTEVAEAFAAMGTALK